MDIIKPFNGIRPTIASNLTIKNNKIQVVDSNLEYFKSDNFSLQIHNLIERNHLQIDDEDCYYIYQVIYEDFDVKGLVALSSIKAINQNIIKPHEAVFSEKLLDTKINLELSNIQFNPVLLLYRPKPEIDNFIYDITNKEKYMECISDKNYTYRLWVINTKKIVLYINKLFEDIHSLYICDGHHRVSAISQIYANPGNENYGHFLSILVPSNQVLMKSNHGALNIEDIINAADENRIFPPNSTWFEPKFPDGFISHIF